MAFAVSQIADDGLFSMVEEKSGSSAGHRPWDAGVAPGIEENLD
jgi:hypothetical protein